MSAFSHSGIWRGLWALLIVAPLSAWLALAVCTLMHQPRAIATGDTFTDAVLQGVAAADPLNSCRKPKASVTPDDGYECSDPEYIPEAQWQAWEQQYTADPRFWVLCFYNRPDPQPSKGSKYFSQRAGIDLYNKCAYLEQARSCGAVDARIVSLLLNETYYAYFFAAQDLPGSQPVAPAQKQHDGAYDRAVWSMGQAGLSRLCDELALLIPQQPQAGLTCARFAYAADEPARGLEYLRGYANSTAPAAVSGWSMLEHSLWRQQDSLLAGSARFCAEPDIGAQQIMNLRALVDNNLDRLASGGAAGELAVFHQALCRADCDPGLSPLARFQAARALGDLAGAVRGKWPHKLDAAQAAALAKLNREAKQLLAMWPKINGLYQLLPDPAQGWPFYRSYLGLAATRKRPLMQRLLLGAADETAQYQFVLDGPMRAQVAKLARFDYSTFSWQAGTP